MSKSLRSSNQGQVLDDIRHALGRNKTVAPPPLDAFSEDGVAANTEIVARFALELGAIGGHVYRIPADNFEFIEQVATLIAKICSSSTAEVALSRGAIIGEMKLADHLSARGLSLFVTDPPGPAEHDRLVARLAVCGAGITGVGHAIAETGTLVLINNESNALLTSLLPPVHIALLRSAQISASLGEAIGKLNIARGEVYRSATLITGPSRTSDVELTLSIGVHGPKELHVIVLD